MVPHDETTASRRQSTHPHSLPHWSVPTARKDESVMGQGALRAGQRFQTIAAGSGIAPHGDWTSGSLALALGCGSCGASLASRLRPFSALLACSCPLRLSPPGQPGDPRTLLPVLPGSARDFIVRLTAHSHVPTVTKPSNILPPEIRQTLIRAFIDSMPHVPYNDINTLISKKETDTIP